MAAKKKMEDEILDKLEKLEKDLEDVTGERDSLKKELSEIKSSISGWEELKNEVKELREFKQEIDAKREREEKLSSLKAKFMEAGIKKEEEYFVTNGDTLLALDDGAVDFMLQELVAFGKTDEGEEKTASEKKQKKAPGGNNGNP